MKIRKIILGGAVVVIGLPILGVLTAVVWISVLDRTNGSIVSSGATREYLLHVPHTYDPAEPTPLVISLHGGAAWPAHQKNLSHWNRLADEHGFIVVYPSGTPQLFGIVRIWRTTPADVMQDVHFISALIDTLEAAYNIDPSRIYANGMSMGGSMAFALSCTLSDRVAAIGMVAAAQSLPSSWCTDTRPVPTMAFHGAADPIVPYDGGPLGDPFNPVKPVYPAVRDFVAIWAQRNQCAANPVESTIASDVVRFAYQDCAEGAPVVLFTLLEGGHTWPGGKPLPEWYAGATNTSIDATAALWAFFREHAADRRDGGG
jgi:polyhydroxybutyrate depolymerase